MSTKEYYISAGFVGDDLLWWRRGDHGYTRRLDDARIFTEAELSDVWGSDKRAWPRKYVDAHAETIRLADSERLDAKLSRPCRPDRSPTEPEDPEPGTAAFRDALTNGLAVALLFLALPARAAEGVGALTDPFTLAGASMLVVSQLLTAGALLWSVRAMRSATYRSFTSIAKTALRVIGVGIVLMLVGAVLVLAPVAFAAEPKIHPEDAGGPVLAGPSAAGAGSCGGEVCGLRTAAAFPPPCAVATGPAAGDPAACGSPGSVALLGDGLRPVAILDGRGVGRCQGTRVPSIGCCPLWRDVALVDAGAGPLLVATYGLGLQVRDAAGVHAAAPQVRDTADGVESCTLGTPDTPATSRWLAFPIHCRGTSEQLNFAQGVDARALPGGGALVAVSAATPAGLSLWRMSSTGVLTAVYQDGAGESADALILDHGGRLYVLALGGLHARLYDASAALARTAPACERCDSAGGPRVPGTATTAPGVYLGQLPVGRDTRYAAVLATSPRLLVALSATVGSQPGTWELRPGLAGVLDPSKTVRRGGPLPGWPAARGLAMVDGLLVAIEGSALVARRPCLGCTAVPAIEWTYPLPVVSATERTLDVSVLDGRTVIYAGVLGTGELGGPSLDAMIEVVGGRPTHNLLGRGGGYLERCREAVVDFWGWLNPRNRLGRNNYQPHRALCLGGFCYHAAEGMLFTSQLPPLTPTGNLFSDGFEVGNASRWSGVRP